MKHSRTLKRKKKMPIHFQIKTSKYQLRRSWQMYIKEKSRFYSQTVEKVINLHNRFPYVLTVSSNIPDLCVWRIKHFALCYSVFFGVSGTRLKNEQFEIYFHVLIVTDLWTWSNLGIKISLFDINKLFQQGWPSAASLAYGHPLIELNWKRYIIFFAQLMGLGFG